ncbi:MAG: hypothetical protein FJY97_11250 [candidate division Zixibacteria bacterium]|nr:hypothetical protein [candidate division Zixibacteria bacterium]
MLYKTIFWLTGLAVFPIATWIGFAPDVPAEVLNVSSSFPLKNFYRGVAWVGGRNPISEEALTDAAANGIEWIAQTPFGWMEHHRSPHIQLNPNPFLWGEADEGLRVTTRMVHDMGIKVMLKPHIWLRRPVDEGWIGEIDFPTEEEWQQWEADYRTFILHYARLAQEENIEILCIATELSNPVRSRPVFWKTLIGEIRKTYSGKLTYAANWYRDYDETQIWADLDYIGINAYFPLTEKVRPSVEEISAGWTPLIDRIGQMSEQFGKPMLFTEVGYKNVEGTTVRPWEWPRQMEGAVVDNTEQANAYEAMFQSFGRQDWFRGAFIWKWYPVRSRLAPDRVEFSPQNKQAEQTLKRWYSHE